MPIKKIFTYLSESREELKKVVWPNKKETTLYTILVIAISVFVALFIAIVDFLLNLGLEQIL